MSWFKPTARPRPNPPAPGLVDLWPLIFSTPPRTHVSGVTYMWDVPLPASAASSPRIARVTWDGLAENEGHSVYELRGGWIYVVTEDSVRRHDHHLVSQQRYFEGITSVPSGDGPGLVGVLGARWCPARMAVGATETTYVEAAWDWSRPLDNPGLYSYGRFNARTIVTVESATRVRMREHYDDPATPEDDFAREYIFEAGRGMVSLRELPR